MKALIKKELRENLKFAVPGFLILSAILFRVYSGITNQPLVNSNFLGLVELVCNLFGLLLGWFQVYPERNRDLWAFLIHRPLTQTQIFMAKAIAGLTIYFVAMGLPLLVLVVVASRPGQFASPFEWAMVLPLAGSFLIGLVWYFAGLLMGLRQARWYASRGLILVAALCLYMLAGIKPAGLPGFWQEPVMIVAGIVLLAAATWGAFQGCGTDTGQPAWGRRALVLSLTMGLAFIGLLSQPLFEVLLHGSARPDSTYFQITRDGVICKITEKADGRSEIMDLSGSPVPDPKTGREVSLADFDRLAAPGYPLNVDFGGKSEVRPALLRPDMRFYSPCKTVDRIRWYWTRAGNLVGYDATTRRLAGTIEPSETLAADAHFLRSQANGTTESENAKQKYSPVILATPRHVWSVNLEERKSQILFTAADGDLIGGARRIGDEGFLVATRKLIEMVDLDGKPVWKTTYKSVNPDALWVRLSRLADAQKYAVWVTPFVVENRSNEGERWTHGQVLFVSTESGLTSETSLPTPKRRFAGWSFWLSALLVPPVPLFYFLLGWKASWLILILSKISLGMAVVCTLVGWWLGRRYHFSTGTQIKWAIFHMLAGLPGFVAFLSVQEWPARETCPHCGKLRVVDQEQCEHCGGSFAPAQKDGTEIFEKLTEDCPVHA